MLDPDNHVRERLMERMRKNEGETGGQTQIYYSQLFSVKTN